MTESDKKPGAGGTLMLRILLTSISAALKSGAEALDRLLKDMDDKDKKKEG